MEKIEDTLKSLKFKNSRYIWNKYHFNSSKNVGCVSDIAKKYMEKVENGELENSLEEFEKFYFTQFNYYRLVSNSKAFKKKLEEGGMKITFNEAYYFTWIRVIYETYNGIVIKETEIINEFKQNGFIVKKSTSQEDKDFAIDFIAVKDGTTFGIQVKPASYYYALEKGKEDVVSDHKVNIEKNNKWLKKFPKNRVIYYFYNKDGSFIAEFEEMKKTP